MFEEITLDTPCLRIAGRRSGKAAGPKLLAVHGWLDNAASFAPLAPHFADHDLVAIDLPGHGRSSHRAPGAWYHFIDYCSDVLAVADALGWPHFALLGHSLGGAVSSMLAAALPERIERLIYLTAFLPRDGEDAMSHQGLGPFIYEFDKYKPTTGFVRPNRLTRDGQEAEIDGVKMQFFHTWGDTDDTLLIWLPEHDTVVNNVAWPTMFNICTLRGDVFRNPLELLRGLEKIIELAPEHLIGVHGQPLHGRELIRQAVTEYRDTIQFTYDQTVRGINAGMSPDELVEFVRLPEALAKGRLTGQFYGELPFHVRQIYSGLMGWFGKDTAELHRPSPKEQAVRTIELAGGAQRVIEAVRAALDKREYAWAAQMASWLLAGGYDTEEHRRLKARALRAMGQVTTAANTRSWYLTQARELEGLVDTRVPPVRFVNPGMVRQMPPGTYVNGLRFQLSPQLSSAKTRRIVLRFSAPDLAYTLHLRNGVVQVVEGESAAPDATLSMPFDAWARMVGRESSVGILVEAGEIRAEGDAELIQAVLEVGTAGSATG